MIGSSEAPDLGEIFKINICIELKPYIIMKELIFINRYAIKLL